MEQRKVTEWIISGNPEKYRVIDAFRDLHKVDWTQSANMVAGDIVYIYVSGDVKAIKLKCKVNKAEIEVPDIDDSEYDLTGEFDGSAGRYMELELLEEYDGVEYTRDELMKHGFKSPLGPVHMPDSVKNYLESIKDSGHKKGKFDSWTIVDEQTARKLTDKSFFEHHGSGIPAEIRWFFDAEDMQNGTKKTISLIYEGKQYDAHVDKESVELGRTRLFWNTDLSSVFAEIKPENGQEFPYMTFHKVGEGKYQLYLGVPDLIHKYTVNESIWIAAALLAAEKYENNPSCTREDMYFKQAQIVHLAETLTDGKVDGARCSWWCCADKEKSDHNYLRGDLDENESARRLSCIDEFETDTCPLGLNYDNPLIMNGHAYTVGDLFDFVTNVYPGIIFGSQETDIDYIGVLNYLKDNTDIPYSNPEAPGIDEEEKKRLLQVKEKGQAAIAEMKKMASAFAVKFKLDKCLPMAWLDGSNTKTRRYLWAQLKYSKYADNPTSVSIFVEKNSENSTRYRISLEIKNDGTDKKVMNQYHSHLDIPIDTAAGLVYVSGSNEWGNPDVINEDQDKIKQDVVSGKLKKVQICKYVERKADETNAYYHTEISKAIAAIIPYYEHVLGIEKIEYYPSLSEYDPGITTGEYERILSDETIVKRAWLDTLHYLYLMGGTGSCKQIANHYGNGAAHYNTNAINVAKAVHKETNCPLCARDTGENQYWPVLFYGRELTDSNEGVFSYKMREPLMEAIKALEERGVFQEMKETNKEFDKNLILYGPPGTGKTYYSTTYAVAICDGKSVDELTDYDAVMARYNELKEAGRIAFTTFHQSYGYEEFIEGIKPVVDDEATDISYTIEPGIFKKFCDVAGTPENMEIDHNAQVWFVRLNGVGKNDLKDECFKEGTIRFSWEKENVDDSYKKWFNMMSPGDYVVSYNGANVNIDGIGIIEDSDPFYDEQKSSFKWTRKVKWLVTDIVENIRELNGGKYLPNFEITKLNRVRISELLELVSKHGGYAGEKNEKPYVFIIDEINRGNISKIFGELITLIESTKRAGMKEAASAILPYSGKPFSVPSNVYILGTMNTADRSIALMDTALRRRFQFIEMMPDSDVLRKIHADKVEDLDVAAMLDKINERIAFLYDREHTIGHAFFTGLKDDASLAKLQSIFEKSVIPLLQEYFYEDYQKIQLVLGDNAKSDDSLKFILDEKVVAKNIFKGNVEDVIDLPEKKYSINKEAFGNINSYKGIL